MVLPDLSCAHSSRFEPAYIHGCDVHTLVCACAQSNLTQWERDLNPKLSILFIRVTTCTPVKHSHCWNRYTVKTEICNVLVIRKACSYEMAGKMPGHSLPSPSDVLREPLQRFSSPIIILYNTFRHFRSVFRILLGWKYWLPKTCWKFKFRTL